MEGNVKVKDEREGVWKLGLFLGRGLSSEVRLAQREGESKKVKSFSKNFKTREKDLLMKEMDIMEIKILTRLFITKTWS